MATEAQIFDSALRKFREAYPQGRIAAEIKFLEPGLAGVKVSVFRSGTDGNTAASSAVASAHDAQSAEAIATVHALKLIGLE